jgi:hypothetical protein
VSQWIGVDLDGTLAYYDEWRGVEHIGMPVPAMIDRVRGWLSEGKEVRIFTARVQFEGAVQPILDWLKANNLPPLTITNVKDSWMHELWDDRAVQVERNTGRQITDVY